MLSETLKLSVGNGQAVFARVRTDAYTKGLFGLRRAKLKIATHSRLFYPLLICL